jgi:hypothetical protein
MYILTGGMNPQSDPQEHPEEVCISETSLSFEANVQLFRFL